MKKILNSAFVLVLITAAFYFNDVSALINRQEDLAIPPRAHSISTSTNYRLAWIRGRSLPAPRYSFAATFASNGNMYAIGGDNYTCTSLRKVEEYNPNTNLWVRKADMPTGRWALGAVTATNGKIYAIGGWGGGCSGYVVGTNEEYDPLTNTWTMKADMPTPRSGLAIVSSASGKIYAIGGMTPSSGTLNIVEEYDPATNSWRNRAGLIVKRQGLSAVELNGKIYAIGGGTAVIGGETAAVEEYDPITNTWRLMAPLPVSKSGFGSVAAWNNRIYAIAGNFNTWTDTVFEFDPSANTWRTVSRVQVPRRALGAAIGNNGKIYAIGGWGPGGIGYLNEGPLSTLEVATISEAGASKPVAVLVHGWAGLPGSQGDDCSFDTAPDQITDINNVPSGDLGVVARNLLFDGWDVWSVHIRTSLYNTPPIQDNAICLRNQLLQIPKPDGQVVLIAHSMGGLVSRAYMEDTRHGFYLNDVSHLVTLGTPHVGTSYGLIPCVSNPGDYAACQFSMLIDNFNNQYSTRARGVNYGLIGGDLTPGVAGAFLFVSEGHNDGVVGAQSGMGRKYHILSSPTTIIQENNYSIVNRYDIPASHSSLRIFNVPDPYWFPSFFTVSANDRLTMTATYACIRQILGIPGGVCPSETTTFRSNSADATPSAMMPTPLITGRLSSGQTTNGFIPLDSSLRAQFDLTWDSGEVDFILTDPDGIVIDPTYASNHSDVIAYFENQTDLDQQLYASYIFTSTLPGDYYFTIHAIDAPVGGMDYQLKTHVESERQLFITSDKGNYQPGDQAVITAQITNTASSSGISGVAVQGEIFQNDVTLSPLTFTEQANGLYSAAYTIPDQPGVVGINITAEGLDAGVKFARESNHWLIIQSNALSLLNTITDSVADFDGNGKYEALNINIPAQVLQAGSFVISGELLDSQMNHVASGVVSTTLTSSTSNIVLSFLGNEILASQLNGPYTLTDLTILDLQYKGVPVIVNAQNVHTTAAYDWTDFASDCFTVVSIIEGDGTIQLSPTPNCNQNTQYSIGTEVLFSAVPNPGSFFTDWSGDITSSASAITVVVMNDMNITAAFSSSQKIFLPLLMK